MPWTPSVSIAPWLNALEVRRRDDVLTFHINGQRAARLPFEPFAGNQVGFAGDGKVDISVDRLIIRAE